MYTFVIGFFSAALCLWHVCIFMSIACSFPLLQSIPTMEFMVFTDLYELLMNIWVVSCVWLSRILLWSLCQCIFGKYGYTYEHNYKPRWGIVKYRLSHVPIQLQYTMPNGFQKCFYQLVFTSNTIRVELICEMILIYLVQFAFL